MKNIKEYRKGYEAGYKVCLQSNVGRTPNNRIKKLKELWKRDVKKLIDKITKPKFTCIPICRDLIKELKAEINRK